jgi:hypothetical protein
MIPGITTKLSERPVTAAASLDANVDLLRVTGTTSLATLVAHAGGGFSQVLFVVPLTGNTATLTTGNIAKAVTMVSNQVTVFVYSKLAGVWYPGAIS